MDDCLRESSILGKSGELDCSVGTCKFRFIPHPDDQNANLRTLEVDRFLERQLRTGSPENSNGAPCVRHGY